MTWTREDLLDRLESVADGSKNCSPETALSAYKMLRADAWVKIEDIPEEWRDGRPVQLFDKETGSSVVCEYDDTVDHLHPWHTLDGISYHPEAFTHARLVSLPEME